MATTARAIGQITIVDLNDAKQVQAYLQNSGADVQIYNPDTNVYTPNFTSSPLTITPLVYVTGNASNQIANCSNITWKVNGTTIASGNTSYVLGNSGTLQIKANLASVNFLQLEFSCTYTDPDTKATDKITAYKTITKSASAGALFSAVITCPKGNVFDASNNTTSLTAEARVYRGGTQDKSGTTFTWAKLNVSTGAWATITSGVSTASGVSTLTVAADDVINFQTYRVTATDSGNSAQALVTFEDKTDPFVVEVLSTTGDKIVNGTGSTTIFARVYRNGELIEDETATTSKFNFSWKKYNKDGAIDSSWTAASGNKQTIAASQISTKATFICEVTEK